MDLLARALALLVAVWAFGCASSFESFERASPRRGDRLPAIALHDDHGERVSVPHDRPTVLVVGSFS